jgi:hypothetical protein
MTPTLTALGGGFRAEIQQLRRSRLLIVLTAVEAVTFLVLVSIFGFTGTHVPTAVVDRDGGKLARQWAQEMSASYHTYGVRYMDARSAQEALGRGDVAAILYIPAGFSQHMAHHSMIRIHFLVDNVNADLTTEVELGIPPAARAFGVANRFPGIRVVSAEKDLVRHEVGFIPYLVVSALALTTFVVAGTLAASAVAREFEGRTLTYLKLSPTHPLVPLAGRLLATGRCRPPRSPPPPCWSSPAMAWCPPIRPRWPPGCCCAWSFSPASALASAPWSGAPCRCRP